MVKAAISTPQIAQLVHVVRGKRVMLDFDLALLYGVKTKALNQAVRRNRRRFPEDFMFQLTLQEIAHLRSQFVTSKPQSVGNKAIASNSSQFVTSSEKRGGQRYRPYAFTEQGVAMLSSVLHGDRAVSVNIAIMRAFVKLRAALESNRALAQKFAELEDRVGKHDQEIAAIIDAIRQLMAPPKKPAREIGFHVRESSPRYGTRTRR
jgi:ORF6N domain